VVVKESKDELSDDKYCFACGPLNPIGLRMEVSYRENKAICRLVLKREFQGWKNIVHGGVVATILDEIMAHAVMHYVGKEIQAEGHVVQEKSRGVVARGEIRGVENQKLIATAESRLVFLV
jgi:acyl-coenzyme A thioesterase PaaI-like protein